MGAIRAAAAVILIGIGVVASAAECVTGTRVLSAKTSVPNLVAGPIAWSGSVLAIAKTQEGAVGAAWIAVYNDDLGTIAGDRLLVNDARALYALEWSGTEFGLFYRTTTQSLAMQRVSMLGEPIGGPIAISPGRPAFTGDQVEVRWSDLHQAYVVAHIVTQGISRGVYLTFLQRNGTQMSDRPLFVAAAETSPLALAVTPGGVVGTFLIASSGSVVLGVTTGVNDSPVTRAVVPMTSGEIQAVAYREEFVLVRTALFQGETVIRWLAVSPTHDITTFDAPLLSGNQDATPQALIVGGDGELALSYIDSYVSGGTLDDTFRLHRFSRSGALISDTPFAPTDVAASVAVSPYPFVWAGGTYLSAAVRDTPDRLTSYLLEYCPLRVEILAPSTVLVGQAVTFSPSTIGGVPGYSYVWKFSNSARTEAGVITTERTFESAGTYTATLVATDATGVSKTATFTFKVVYPRRRGVRG